MVHGLEGSSQDLRNIRSTLRFYCPQTIFILSEENEYDTKDNIENLGMKLAREIKTYLKYNNLYEKVKISFVGHSLGGLIIRASLSYLKKYKKCFHTFMTMGSPHLGCSSNRFLVSTGMKIISKMKSQKSVREMSLNDKSNYLQKLS